MTNYLIIIVIVTIVISIVLIYNHPESFGKSEVNIPQNMVFVPCEGDYALCYYAKCKLNHDGTAECGCQEFHGTSFVDVNNIIPSDVKENTQRSCPYGLVSCPYINEAPVCDYVNQSGEPELISTFSSGSPKFTFEGTQSCPAGLYANCMTAQCKRETAWDGSPVTCRCPVSYDTHTIAKGIGDCQLPDGTWSGPGTIWSGVPA